MDINAKFAGFMAAVMPKVSPDSPEWWFAKKGFLGGVGVGLGGSGLSVKQRLKLAESMEALYDEANMEMIMRQVPAEHRLIGPGGEKCLSEQGMIHFATIAEQMNPEDAERIRRARYAMQAHMQKLREGGQNNG